MDISWSESVVEIFSGTREQEAKSLKFIYVLFRRNGYIYIQKYIFFMMDIKYLIQLLNGYVIRIVQFR